VKLFPAIEHTQHVGLQILRDFVERA